MELGRENRGRSNHGNSATRPPFFPLPSLLLHRHPAARAPALGGDANHTTRGTTPSVARLERLGVTTLAEVVGAGVDDDGAANDRLRADEREVRVWGGADSGAKR